jgi:dihydrofolate synthase / folylpolyglutamate synthase
VTYAEATAFLYGLRRFGWRPGLATIQRLLSLLDDPQTGIPAVHIGGTNGKGSTAAMLDAILRAAGCRTGLYTSPHLLSFTERIRVDGEPIGEAEVVALTEKLKALCAVHFTPEATLPVDDLPPHPTFFELTTAMAFLHFRRRAVEAAVIEVGLGGRLDATNVIQPRVTVITNIALEHQEYLGRTLTEIAGEKAGIIKTGTPIVTAARGDALEVIRQRAAHLQAPVVFVPEAYRWEVRESSLVGQTFDLEGPRRRYEALRVALAGRHQVENAVLAVAAAEAAQDLGFSLDAAAIRRGLAETAWPGRLQVVQDRPRIILDGAHNPAGTEALAAFLAEHRAALGRLILVFGVLQDKDWKTMLGLLAPLADQIILTRPPGERGADPAALLPAAQRHARTTMAADPERALAQAREAARAEDTILVAGSLYTVAAALRAIGSTSGGPTREGLSA